MVHTPAVHVDLHQFQCSVCAACLRCLEARNACIDWFVICCAVLQVCSAFKEGPASLMHKVSDVQAGTFESANTIVDMDSPLLLDLMDEMEDAERYMAMAQLLRKLLHPDLSSRATADQALTELELMP